MAHTHTRIHTHIFILLQISTTSNWIEVEAGFVNETTGYSLGLYQQRDIDPVNIGRKVYVYAWVARKYVNVGGMSADITITMFNEKRKIIGGGLDGTMVMTVNGGHGDMTVTVKRL